MNWWRFFLLLSFAFMSVGFRLIAPGYSWKISESDPYLWIKPCSYTVTFDDTTLGSTDRLSGFNGTLTLTNVLQSIADDYSDIYGSYLKLEVYPEDVANIPVGNHYTAALATDRVIDICAGDSDGSSAGYAKLKTSGKTITGCTIVYEAASAHKEVKEDLRVLTHEIGHCIGLTHPQEITQGIMSYYPDPGLYRLEMDDRNGIRYLFPRTDLPVSIKEDDTYGLSCAFKK